ncbi:unnamed protein product [Gongylonema pulchrum]|uniref:Reverse transcriptase/retrotransposon-derived protein RNase H-like domain-containing protein n=1 Tax=Gongylonema pulchrum TaxID=637853 RepID=A0A3P7NR61_9BILA|nr:unnamed protein product [Gongylonema pulchrum]
MKEKLRTTAVLTQPDIEDALIGTDPFQINTDACSAGLGAVLTQKNANDHQHPIHYVSKVCSKAESKYHVTDLEALAIVLAL